MHHPKRLLIAGAIAALTLSACAPMQVGFGGSAGVSTAPVTFNGITLTPGAKYNLAGLETLPAVRTSSDVRALQQMIRLVVKARDEAANDGRVLDALVFGDQAGRMALMQAMIAESSRAAARDLIATSGERVTLQPGAYAVVPAMSSSPTPMRTAAHSPEAPQGLFFTFNAADGVQVASSEGGFGGVLRAINQVLERTVDTLEQAPGVTPVRRSAPNPMGNQHRASQYIDMPANIPFALPNGAIVERVVEGDGTYFIMHNPTAQTAFVPANQLGYFPPAPPLSKVRRDAAPMMVRISEHIRADRIERAQKGTEFSWDHFSGVRQRFGGYSRNGTTDMPSYLAPDASLTRDSRVHLQAVEISRNRNHPFGRAVLITSRAVEAARQWGCEDRLAKMTEDLKSGNYQTNPFGVHVPQGDYRSVRAEMHYRGPHAENLTTACIRLADGAVLSSTQFFVGEERVARTAEDLYKLQLATRQLELYDRKFDAAEDVSTILPFVGNVTSFFRCFGHQPGRAIAKYSNDDYRNLARLRAVTNDMYAHEVANPDWDNFQRGLDCAAGVAAVGPAMQVTGKLIGALKSSDQGAQTLQSSIDFINAFNTRVGPSGIVRGAIEAGEVVGAVDRRVLNPRGLPSALAPTAKLAKPVYDVMQSADNATEALAGMVELLK